MRGGGAGRQADLERWERVRMRDGQLYIIIYNKKNIIICLDKV